MELYKLTQPQYGIWETESFYQGTSIGNIGGTLLLKEELNFKLWEKAINKFIELNDSCRIRIKMVDDEPFQYISDYKYIPLSLVNFNGKTKSEQDNWISEQMKIPFHLLDNDLFELFMIKANNGEHGLYLKMHHLIGDGWTISLLCTQIMNYYKKFEAGEDNQYNERPSYTEYIKKEQEYLSSSKLVKDKEYWLSKFKDKPQLASIKLRESNVYNLTAERETFIINKKKADELRTFCKENSSSPAILFEAALRIYFSRFVDIQDATVGFPVLNRNGSKEKETTGMFVSSVPMRLILDDNETFVKLCKKIALEHMEVFRHQRYPYNVLLSEIRKMHGITHNIYEVAVSYQNAKILKKENDYEYKTRWYSNGSMSEQLQIHIDDRDDEGTFVVHIDYLHDLFSADEVCELYKRIMIFTEQGIQNMGLQIKEMELVDDMERQQLLFEYNDTYTDFIDAT